METLTSALWAGAAHLGASAVALLRTRAASTSLYARVAAAKTIPDNAHIPSASPCAVMCLHTHTPHNVRARASAHYTARAIIIMLWRAQCAVFVWCLQWHVLCSAEARAFFVIAGSGTSRPISDTCARALQTVSECATVYSVDAQLARPIAIKLIILF